MNTKQLQSYIRQNHEDILSGLTDEFLEFQIFPKCHNHQNLFMKTQEETCNRRSKAWQFRGSVKSQPRRIEHLLRNTTKQNRSWRT